MWDDAPPRNNLRSESASESEAPTTGLNAKGSLRTCCVPADSLAYSVDADDAFMFHALEAGAIDTRGLTFTHQRAHTGALEPAGDSTAPPTSSPFRSASCRRSLRAIRCCRTARRWGAASVPSWWPSGRPLTPRDLAGLRVGIPGATTTAWLVLRLSRPQAIGVEIPIAPFGRIFDALDAGEVDAALLIHEGRMLYRERGLELVVDLGAWWESETGLPLPLGRQCDPQRAGRATGRPGLGDPARQHRLGARPPRADHREIAAEDRGDKALSDQGLIDEYLNLYANHDTAAMADDARRAVDVLFARARRRAHARVDLRLRRVTVDWAP